MLRKQDLKYIDLATGTGDLLINVLRKNPQIQNAVGIDASENMLTLCNKKISKQNFNNKTSLITADITEIPFSVNSFDAATVGFGIRNTNDVPKALSEIYRIYHPDICPTGPVLYNIRKILCERNRYGNTKQKA
jgi:demethylmenaquinone methyltransferase/2-methoxy-6-polyprenyl-1,4-benzoquinol methylase